MVDFDDSHFTRDETTDPIKGGPLKEAPKMRTHKWVSPGGLAQQGRNLSSTSTAMETTKNQIAARKTEENREEERQRQLRWEKEGKYSGYPDE